MLKIVALAALVVALAACGGGANNGSGTSQGSSIPNEVATSPTVDATTPTPISDDPQVIAKQLKAAIPQIGAIVKVTEDNDENSLIGRPGQYDAATFMEDTRLGCSGRDDFDGLSIDCGAKLERWPSESDAHARANDIQTKLKAYGLGAEYDYVRDRVILRVAGALKPSEAKEYEKAFLG